MSWPETWRWPLVTLSGLLLILCFPPFAWSSLGWIALVPAWWALRQSASVRQKPFRYGWWLGLIYFLGVFWWIGEVIGLTVVLLAAYLALFPALWFLCVARLIRSGPYLSAFFAAALWVVLEWWRSWLFTGFNWDELGVTQAPSLVFRQLAAYGGVPLLSFLLVAINVLWAEGLLEIIAACRAGKIARVPGTFWLALFLLAFAFSLGEFRLFRPTQLSPHAGLSYACIQPNIPQIPYDGGPYATYLEQEDQALRVHVQLSEQAIRAEPPPDLLIWPEATISEGVFQDRPMNEAVHQICLTYNGYFLLGSEDDDVTLHQIYNVAYLFTPGGEQYDYYRKTRLVVLGEYLPFSATFPWLRHWLNLGLDFTPGPGPKRFSLTRPNCTFAPLICFEDTLPEVADKAARLQPDFFITITNDGWYQGWCARWGIAQHLENALFRCIEHDRPMLRCANTGISCLIDQDGTVTNALQDSQGRETDVRGILTGRLFFHPPETTFYENWGGGVGLLCALLTLFIGFRFLLFYRFS